MDFTWKPSNELWCRHANGVLKCCNLWR